MSEPPKHHFSPQFYLELFKIRPQATKYPKILVTTKKLYPRKFSAAIHDIGCIDDYHTIDPQNIPIDRSGIEKVLSKIEGVPQNYCDVEAGLTAFYKAVFSEDLRIRFSVGKGEKAEFTIGKNR